MIHDQNTHAYLYIMNLMLIFHFSAFHLFLRLSLLTILFVIRYKNIKVSVCSRINEADLLKRLCIAFYYTIQFTVHTFNIVDIFKCSRKSFTFSKFNK